MVNYSCKSWKLVHQGHGQMVDSWNIKRVDALTLWVIHSIWRWSHCQLVHPKKGWSWCPDSANYFHFLQKKLAESADNYQLNWNSITLTTCISKRELAIRSKKGISQEMFFFFISLKKASVPKFTKFKWGILQMPQNWLREKAEGRGQNLNVKF